MRDLDGTIKVNKLLVTAPNLEAPRFSSKTKKPNEKLVRPIYEVGKPKD